MEPPVKDERPINEMIQAPEVRLIGAEGEQIGVVSREDALDRSANIGLDLVIVADNANPPVCKIMDYGKFKYEEQKKKNEARKKQKTIDVKEIKLRPNIDSHDYDVKMRSMLKFLNEGDKVKVTMRFRGREMAHQNLGLDVLNRVRDDLEQMSKVEQFPRFFTRFCLFDCRIHFAYSSFPIIINYIKKLSKKQERSRPAESTPSKSIQIVRSVELNQLRQCKV